MDEVEEAHDALKRVMKAHRKETGKGAWTAERLRSAKKAVERATADYRVASAAAAVLPLAPVVREELGRLNRRVNTALAAFSQYINEKRLDYARARREAVYRPAGESEDEDRMDTQDSEFCRELDQIGKRAEKQAKIEAANQAKASANSDQKLVPKPEQPTVPVDRRTNNKQPGDGDNRQASEVHVVVPRGRPMPRRQRPPCLACSNLTHSAAGCNAFRGLNLSSKKAIVWVSGACENCLRLGHAAVDCGSINGAPYNKECPRCQGVFHNSLLCDQ